MQSVLRLVLVDPVTESRESVKRMFADMDPVWLEAECPRYDHLPDILGQTSPDIIVLNLDADWNEGLQMVATTSRSHPNTRIFVTSSNSDSSRILQAMRSGAHEFLTTPIQMEELLPALDRVRQAKPGSSTSTVTSITGVVGGVGSTCIAVNLGCLLAQNPNRRVVLVDLDMLMGDADVCLDIVHNYTLIDVVENINRLDFSLLKRSLVQHKSGLWFLPHPSSLNEVSRVHPDGLRRLIGLLKATFSHVILNLSNGFRDTDITAMQASDTVLLVAQLDVSCVRNLSRMFKALDSADGLLDRFKVVMNRVGAKDLNVPIEKVEEMIDREIFWQIPNDWQSMTASRVSGVPLILHAPKSKVSVSLAKLAEELVGKTVESESAAATPKRRGLFSMFSGAAS